MPFILYRSSAGSGKTYTLVKEYLKIVLKNPDDFKHILAITFTNKAAKEMKDRILRNLREILDPDCASIQSMIDSLSQELKMDKTLIISRAGQVLTLILHQYTDFNVTTIDSFMNRVIRTFAFDMHLPLDFEVELDNDHLVEKAVNNLIRQVGHNEALTKVLIDIILNKSEDEKGWNIEKDLFQVSQQLFKEKGQLAMDKMQRNPLDLETARNTVRMIRKLTKTFENRIKSLGSQAVDLIRERNIPYNAFYQGEKGLPKYFTYLAEGQLDKLEPGSFVKATIESAKWLSQSATFAESDSIEQIKDRLRNIYFSVIEIKEKELTRYHTLKVLEKSILPLAILSLIDNELREIKKENNLLPIGEFNKRIANTILGEPVPFIYERLGEWYHYYLIDEFQDTSVLQWLNLFPLIENSLAGNYTCILVGDGKQAIYRWRNGDVEQFSRLPDVVFPENNEMFQGRQKILQQNYKEFKLENNFRTAAEIVAFNNDFFSTVSALLGEQHQPVYEGVIQKHLESNTGGYVSVEFLEQEEESENVYDEHLARIQEIVRKCHDDGYDWKDIAILCRSNANASLAARHLMEAEINVSSSESILLSKSPVVNVILSCLHFLINPSDRVHYEVLSRFYQKSGRSLEEIMKINSPGFRGMPIYELCELLVRELKMDRAFNPFIVFFLDTVLEFSRRQDSSIPAFLEWWNDNSEKISLITPDEYDAVKVMTIHRSKGLEFDIVICPFAFESRRTSDNSLWVSVDDASLPELKTAFIPFHKNLESSFFKAVYEEEEHKTRLDFLNVLYVAMTRPRQRLYVLTGKPAKDYNKAGRTSDLFGIYQQSKGIDPMTLPPVIRGAEKVKENKNTGEPSPRVYDTIYSSDWRSRISIRKNSPENWDMSDPGKPRSVGNVAHNVLATVKSLKDIEEVRSALMSERPYDEAILSTIDHYLKNMQEDSSLLPFFDTKADIRSEAEIITPGGKTFRPDRLAIFPGRVLILDYKTGIPQESHATQLVHYAKLLKEMGYPTVEGYLYYLDDNAGLKRVC